MIFTLNNVNTVANNYLAQLRDKSVQNDRSRFRNNVERIGELLAYEISKTFTYAPRVVHTPLDTTEVSVVQDEVVLIGILRAAVPMLNGFVRIFTEAEIGFIGAYRVESSGSDEETKEEIKVNLEYSAAPDLEGKTVIVIDPMLATGKSMVEAISTLAKNGSPVNWHIASIIASPEGVDYVQKGLNDHNVKMWTGALDERLDANSYIVPGLGDAGDLSYGIKLP